MVSGAASTLVNVGVVGFTAGVAGDIAKGAKRRGIRKGKREMPHKDKPPFKNRTRAGTKRFPRGRVVTDPDADTKNKFAVVVGSAIDTTTGRRVIAIQSGGTGKRQTTLVSPSDISPVTIRRSVVGLKGRGSLKPRLKDPLTPARIKKARGETQAVLDRA